MTVSDARSRLTRLHTERFEATAAGVTACAYLARLEAAIGDARRDYDIAALTEIAALRIELSLPLPAGRSTGDSPA